MAIDNSSGILQAVIEATPDAIFVKDLDGRYVVVNEAAARFLGRSPAEIIGKHDLELYPEATARQFIEDDRRVLASGGSQTFEGVAESAAGTQAYLVTKGVYRDSAGAIVGIYGISHDVTELNQARASLEQARDALFRSQKLEAVGQLTGGIAHDFNNILSVIIGNLDLVRLQLQRSTAQGDPRVFELIDGVLRAALHGRDLIGQLLAFAGRRRLNPQAIDVDRLVETMVRLVNRTLGSSIQVHAVPNAAGQAFVDPSALEAALLNVALNARDAMPGGGTVVIRTSRQEITAAAVKDDDPAPGAYVLIEIEDTGTGMTPEVMARAFEPFFTTKSATGGTGLGLSMVYGFAKQSGGAVALRSTPGTGTTISMYLPSC